MGIFLKHDIRAAAIAVILVAAGLFWWHVAALEDCRTAVRQGGMAGERLFRKSECPETGPYDANSSVFLFAVLSPLFPSATAEQRDRGPQSGR